MGGRKGQSRVLPFEMKKDAPTGGIKKPMIVLSVALFVLLAAAVAANIYAAGQTGIFWQTGYDNDIQNSRILVDEELGITFLGAYNNSVRAYDGDGNSIWFAEIGGAVEAMVYDSERDWLIVGSQDRNVYIYAAADGANINTYTLKGRVYDMDYDQAGGRLLVSSGVSKTKHELLVLDIVTGKELNKVSTKKVSRAAKFASDKQHIIYGTNQGRVILCNLEGEKIAEQKVSGEMRSLAVVEATGEVVTMDKAGYLYKFDKELNEVCKIELLGEGRCVSASADGKWIAAGTREGDIHILNSEGESQFSTRQESDVSQIYFGEKQSYVVTLSADLYGFDAKRLENIGMMDAVRSASIYAIAALAVGLAAALIAAFPRSRWMARRFFRSAYRHRVAYLMLAPSIILILVFQYYNVFQAFWYAFTDWSLATKTMREVNFIGFDNFVKMFTEGYFLLGTKNLVIMIICSFVKLLTVPLLVVPMVVPGVVSTLMWKNIYDPNIGALNSLLDVMNLSQLKHSWLGDERTALWSIIFMGFPFVNSFAFLVYYGGLINIPSELFEAARVDGSNALWNFTHIHMPLITPQLKMLIVTTFISAVQDYGGVYLLTGGGPGTATYVPGLELYYAATKFGQYGYACAMGLVMFIVILIGSLINMRMKTQELS